jgi:hypothetical protein
VVVTLKAGVTALVDFASCVAVVETLVLSVLWLELMTTVPVEV